jgi:transcription antitermination factor NusG
LLPAGVGSDQWFALQVRARWESSTAVQLSGKGYPTLLPTYRITRRRGARRREVDAPLFPGYVFCQFDPYKRLPILITPGVIAVVSCGRIPLPVTASEIAAIQLIVSSGVRAEPWPYLELGYRVRVVSGSFEGLEGILIQFKGNQRIVVSISLLRRSVAVEIERACVRPLGPSRPGVQSSIASPSPQEDVGLGQHPVYQHGGSFGTGASIPIPSDAQVIKPARRWSYGAR